MEQTYDNPKASGFATIPKRIITINDLTGFGRCSLAVVLPVISAMQVQACPVPASVFSNHMGFPTYYHRDLTDGLEPFLKGLSDLGLSFDGVYCGFLSSVMQCDIVCQFIRKSKENALSGGNDAPVILIDPVMGDNGSPYRIVTPELQLRIRELSKLATILTPNLTEACLLTDTAFPSGTPEDVFLHELCFKLLSLGPSRVAITGIHRSGIVRNYCMEQTADGIHSFVIDSPCNGESRPGTGDIFASILAADGVKHIPFRTSVQKAADFIRTCVDASEQAGVPVAEGVVLENCLSLLYDQSSSGTITAARK